jgi:hypothetical protein
MSSAQTFFAGSEKESCIEKRQRDKQSAIAALTVERTAHRC